MEPTPENINILKSLKEKTYKWAMLHLKGTSVFNESLGQQVHFNKAGLRKTILARTISDKKLFIENLLTLLVVENLPRLVRKAIVQRAETDKRKGAGIKSIHKLISDISIPGHRDYLIEIVVRETTSGTFFYQHEIIKKRSLGQATGDSKIAPGIKLSQLRNTKLRKYFEKVLASLDAKPPAPKRPELLHGIPVLSDQEEKELGGAATLRGLGGSDVYRIITDMVIKKIESEEDLAWRVPWKSSMAYGLLPTNFISKNEYRGVNTMLLQFLHNRENPYWLTFNQLNKLKGQIKKGSKSAIVIYYKLLYKNGAGELVNGEDAGEDDETIPMLRYYRVFNGDDIEGIDWKLPEKAKERPEQGRIESAEAIVEKMPNKPEIRHSKEARAYYHPVSDYVHMPNTGLFDKVQEYYSTLFHELTHSTKHASRLGTSEKRKGGNRFGDKHYALEELVAEMGASFLCGEAGILYFTLDNTAAYIKSWKKAVLKYFRDDKKAFFTACSEAQKSTDYILDRLDISEEQKVARRFNDMVSAKEVHLEDVKDFLNWADIKTKASTSFLIHEVYFKSVQLLNRMKEGNVNKAAVNLKDKAFAEMVENALYVPIERKRKRTEKPNETQKALFEKFKKTKGNLVLDYGQIDGLASRIAAIDGKEKRIEHFAEALQYAILPIKDLVKEHKKDALDSLKDGSQVYTDSLERSMEIGVIPKNMVPEIFKAKAIAEKINKISPAPGAMLNHALKILKYNLKDLNDFASKVIKSKGINKTEGMARAIAKAVKKAKNKKKPVPGSSTKKSDRIPVAKKVSNTGKKNDRIPKANDPVKGKKKLSKELSQLFTNIDAPSKLSGIKSEVIQLPGPLGKFLGLIERLQYALLLRGDKGAGKTRLTYQLMDLFASQNFSVATFSLEIMPESDLVKRMKDAYIAPANRELISISGEAPGGIGTVREAAKYFDVIMIDSFGKLHCPQTELDRLRNDFPHTFFIIVFQSTTAGTARGGSGAEYDAGAVLQINDGGMAEFEKNRYATDASHGKVYSVFGQKLIDPEEEKRKAGEAKAKEKAEATAEMEA